MYEDNTSNKQQVNINNWLPRMWVHNWHVIVLLLHEHVKFQLKINITTDQAFGVDPEMVLQLNYLNGFTFMYM